MQFEVKQLERNMKLFGAILITLSSLTPASSIFIIAPDIVKQAGTGAFLCLLIGGFVSLLTALVYAELSSAFPLTGGEYSIVGRVLGPLPGFIVLGVNLIVLILAMAVIALGIGEYISVIIPDVPTITAGVVTVIFTTLCAVLNIRTNALITGAFLLVELLALVVLAWLGFGDIQRPFWETFTQPVALSDSGLLQPLTLGMIGMATSIAIFVFNGYGNAVYLGEETKDAHKLIARAIIWSLVIGALAEIIPITAVLLGTPDLTQALSNTPQMLSNFIELRGGTELNKIISLGIALAIINANIAFVVLVARLLYSTGRDQVWTHKINFGLTRLHPRFQSPWIATLACGVLCVGACFIDFHLLTVMTGTGLVVIYGMLCVAVIQGRRNGTTAHAHYRMPFFPLPPIIALCVLAYVVYGNFMDAEVGHPSLIATGGMILASVLYYFLVLKRRGTWVLRNPEEMSYKTTR